MSAFENGVGGGDVGGAGDGDSLRSSPANLTSLLDDISLLQQSQVDLVDDTINTSTLQTYGLEDLSCSMIHCNEGGDFDVDADKFCEEIKKKDQLILSLYNALKNLTKQRQEGEKILSSVENQVRYVHKVLTSRTELLEGEKPKSITALLSDAKLLKTNDSNAVVTDLNNEVTGDNKTSVTQPNHQVVPIQSPEVLSPSINLQSVSNNEKEQISKEASQLESTSKNSNFSQISHSVTNSSQLFLPGNPESMRLTYSPTICEYEAEGRNSPGDIVCHQSVIDDLKLQLLDRDRKLESTKKYLSEMTIEREAERDEFQHTIEDLIVRCEDLKKEKERSDKIVLQQKTELEDMMENLVATNRLKDEIIRRSQSSENELKIAVDKICELREIIRNLEDQVEDATKQAALYSEIKRGFCEDLRNAEEEIKLCTESIRYPEEDVSSVMDYTDELHVQVMELSRKVEEKLVELENFPWQGRPESSCSVKSGDDVSVRANAKLHNTSESTDGGVQDFFSRLSQGFRRLECNFEGLVRFEEVLMKKFSDAELKYKNEHHKFENLSLENKRLRKELEECRSKMIDFERFINESSNSFSSRQHETLRNVGINVLHRLGDSSPAIKRHRSEDANRNLECDEASDAEDYVDVEDVPSAQQTARHIPNSNHSVNQGLSQASTSASVGPQQARETGTLSLSQVNVVTSVFPSINTSRVSTTYNIVNNFDGKTASSASQNKSQVNTHSNDALDYDEIFAEAAEGLEVERKSIQGRVSFSEDNSMQRLESEELGNGIASSSRNKITNADGSENKKSRDHIDEDWTTSANSLDRSAMQSMSKQQWQQPSSESARISSISVNPDARISENIQNGSSAIETNFSETSQDGRSRNLLEGQLSGSMQGVNSSSPVQGNFSRSSQDGGSRNRIDNSSSGIMPDNSPGSTGGSPLSGSTDEQSLDVDNKPGGPRKSQLPPNRGLILATDIHLVDYKLDGGRRIPSDDPNVDVYEITTVSDFEVEGGDVRYLGSHILPAADLSLDPQSARDSRIDSVSDKIELEKIKTRLNMAQEALEEEKRKSDQLKRQLKQISPYSGSTDDHTNVQTVRDLEQALEQQERTETLLRRNIECAMAAIANLKAENEGLRETIRDLKNDLQRMQP